ncbi:MAG TPA: hypothetical protein VM328_03155 [Fimbriimonadaceae bacterium]|nr:hypothetical protein [Fimbriimonadaceae bacterium]
MFPILPAILILLLQGPGSIDRLAESGRLPSALQALHSRLDTPSAAGGLGAFQGAGGERVLSCLLALGSGNTGGFQATLSLLLGLSVDATEPREWSPPSLEGIHPDPVHFEPFIAELAPGFVPGARTRDGPVHL